MGSMITSLVTVLDTMLAVACFVLYFWPSHSCFAFFLLDVQQLKEFEPAVGCIYRCRLQSAYFGFSLSNDKDAKGASECSVSSHEWPKRGTRLAYKFVWAFEYVW